MNVIDRTDATDEAFEAHLLGWELRSEVDIAADVAVMCDVAVLSAHYRDSTGMTYGSPDRCACGTETWPERGDDDVTIRRARAFAEHQAEMLAASR